MQIRPMTASDLPHAIGVCAQNGWGDMSQVFQFHHEHADCLPFVAEVDGEIVGTAVATMRGAVGWIGQISVLAAHRGRGLGTALTRHTMAVLTSQGCSTLALFATEMGRPIYEKLGFVGEAEFVVWMGRPLPAVPSGVRRAEPGDLPGISALDRQATGQDRSAQLRAFGAGGWVLDDGTGFLIPAPWGAMTGSAAGEAAGRLIIDLTRATKEAESEGVYITLPAANQPGTEYLLSLGFQQTARLPRMLLGEPLRWDPNMVYGRLSGALD